MELQVEPMTEFETVAEPDKIRDEQDSATEQEKPDSDANLRDQGPPRLVARLFAMTPGHREHCRHQGAYPMKYECWAQQPTQASEQAYDPKPFGRRLGGQTQQAGDQDQAPQVFVGDHFFVDFKPTVQEIDEGREEQKQRCATSQLPTVARNPSPQAKRLIVRIRRGGVVRKYNEEGTQDQPCGRSERHGEGQKVRKTLGSCDSAHRHKWQFPQRHAQSPHLVDASLGPRQIKPQRRRVFAQRQLALQQGLDLGPMMRTGGVPSAPGWDHARRHHQAEAIEGRQEKTKPVV